MQTVTFIVNVKLTNPTKATLSNIQNDLKNTSEGLRDWDKDAEITIRKIEQLSLPEREEFNA